MVIVGDLDAGADDGNAWLLCFFGFFSSNNAFPFETVTVAQYCLKVVSPPSSIEFYHHLLVAERLQESKANVDDIVLAKNQFVYKNASCMMIPRLGQHSLQDVAEAYQKSGKQLEEPLVMFYAVEMMRVVATLHNAGVMHCKIGLKSFLLKNREW